MTPPIWTNSQVSLLFQLESFPKLLLQFYLNWKLSGLLETGLSLGPQAFPTQKVLNIKCVTDMMHIKVYLDFHLKYSQTAISYLY